MLTYYNLVSLCRLLLGIGAVLFCGLYVSSMFGVDILLNSYQLNSVFVPLAVPLAFCFLLRRRIRARLIINLLRYGRHAIATVLEAEKIESVYSSPSPGDGFDDIYRLRLRVDTGNEDLGVYDIVVFQPFHPRAKSLLISGNILSVKYAPETRLTIVTNPESVPWLTSKSYPIFRQLVIKANPVPCHGQQR